MCDFGCVDSVWMKIIDKHAIDDSRPQIFDSGLIDLDNAVITLRVRLIQLIICERLHSYCLDLYIQIIT